MVVKKKELSPRALAAVFTKLEEVIEVHENGKCSYKEGYDDRVVAAAVGYGANADQISRIRRKEFGNLYRPNAGGKTKQYEQLEQRVTKLEELVDQLMKGLGGV